MGCDIQPVLALSEDDALVPGRSSNALHNRARERHWPRHKKLASRAPLDGLVKWRPESAPSLPLPAALLPPKDVAPLHASPTLHSLLPGVRSYPRLPLPRLATSPASPRSPKTMPQALPAISVPLLFGRPPLVSVP